MRKLFRKMNWTNSRHEWNEDEIVIDLFIMSMIFTLGVFCSYIYYV